MARDAEASYQAGDTMPWGRFSGQLSRVGSRVGLPGQSAVHSSGGVSYGGFAMSSSVGLGSVGPGSIQGRGGPRVSASPLASRHKQLSLLEKMAADLNLDEEEEGYLGSVQQEQGNLIDDFEFFGPGKPS